MKKVILLLIILLTSGCYNQEEINDLAIVNAIGIDYIDNEFKVSVSIINFKDEKENTIVLSSNGKTVESALNKLNDSFDRRIYIDQLKLLLINKEALKLKPVESINYLVNYPSAGISFLVSSVEDNTESILKIITTNSLSVTTIIDILNNSELYGSFHSKVTFDMFLNSVISNNTSIILPVLEINDKNIGTIDKEKTFIINKEIIINNNHTINYLEGNENIGYNLLKNKDVITNTLTIPCDENYFTIYLKEIKSSINPINNNEFDIKIKAKSSISDYNCKTTTNENRIKNDIETEIKKIINKTILKSINTKTDFIGFGNILYSKNYQFYKTLNKDYEQYYLDNIKYNVNVNITLNKFGNLNNNLNNLGDDLYK